MTDTQDAVTRIDSRQARRRRRTMWIVGAGVLVGLVFLMIGYLTSRDTATQLDDSQEDTEQAIEQRDDAQADKETLIDKAKQLCLQVRATGQFCSLEEIESGLRGDQGLPGRDSMIPGPAGPPGQDGQDSIVPGPIGPPGKDGAPGQDGADSTTPGPAGQDGTTTCPEGYTFQERPDIESGGTQLVCVSNPEGD